MTSRAQSLHQKEETAEFRASVMETKPGSIFWNIFQSSPMGILSYRLESDGRLVFVGANPAASAILGVDSRQFIGKTIEEAFPPLAQTEVPERYRRACLYGESWHTEQIAYADGRIQGVYEVHAFATSPGTMAAMFREVTNRRLADIALKQSEERFRRMAESIQDGLTVIENEKVVYVNNRACEIFGYAREELMQMTRAELAAPEDKDRVAAARRQRIDSKVVPARLEYRIVRKDGSQRYIQDRYSLNYNDSGEVVGCFIVTTDITESMEAAKLQESVYRIAQAVDTTSGLDDLYSAVRDIVAEVMPADNFYIALHDPVEDVVTFPYFIDEVDPPPPPQKLGRGLTAYVLRTGRSLRCDLDSMKKLAGSGEVKLEGGDSLIWLGVPLKIEGRTIGVMTVQHYSDAQAYGEREKQMLEFVSSQVAKAIERKRAEVALRASEELNRDILTQTPVGTAYLDSRGVVLYANPAIQRISGLPAGRPAPLVGQSIDQALNLSTSEREKTVDRVLKGETISNVRIEHDSEWGHAHALDLSGAPRRDASGHIIGAVLMVVDATEWVKLERQYRQAQKMEAMGRLAGGIAHDFNNLITVISGNAELALLSLAETDPLHQDMKQILEAAERAANLTRQLLAFSRKQAFHLKVINLNDIILNMDKMLRRVMGEDVGFTTRPAEGLWNVEADTGSLEQVILNLAINARDAMPKGGRLSIETCNVELDEDYVREHPGARTGPFGMMAISDTGVGMSPEVKQRIFEPFFTTKELGRGTGLGLAMVYGVVKQSGGYICVHSEPGMGSTFKIYLPAVHKDADNTPRPEASAAVHGDETILVIEDEDAVRSMVARILKQNGYRVIEAGSGGEAIDLSGHMPHQVDLLITDVIMPQMTGPEVAGLLSKKWPSLKLLYISGYMSDIILRKGALDADTPYLQKPFSPIDLARKVREILDR